MKCAGLQFPSIINCVGKVGVFGSFPWDLLLRDLEVRTIIRGIFPHILSVEKVTHQKAGRKTGRSWEKLEEMPGCSQPGRTISCSPN